MKKLLHYLLMSTRYLLYSFIIQALLVTVLLAKEGNAQVRSINDVILDQFELKDVQLPQALSKIEKLTSFTFVYTRQDLPNEVKINLSVRNQSLGSVLLEISKQARIKFQQVNRNISVKKIESVNEKSQKEIEIIIQTSNISGTVTSMEDGDVIPGVNVIEKGTSNGTVTNINGMYNLEVSQGATLVFSSVGYTTEEIEIGNRSIIDLQMVQDIKRLQELVVVGYGTQERKDITGAVSSVKAEQIEKLSIQSLDQALQGQAAGVLVTQNSGEPGGNISVRIRGVGSFGNNEPLYVIDGFPVFNDNGRVGSAGFSNNQFNSLAMINPKDIESIEILKDASAAAIYGSRAANGVVLITTKKGKAGEAKISFSSDIGLQEAWRIPEFLNASEFAELANEAYINDGEPIYSEWADPESLGEGTDWMDQIFRTGLMQDYNFSVQGGSEKLQAAFTLNYFDQEGVLIESGFQRYSMRGNLDYAASDKLKIGTRSTISYSDQQVFESGNFANGLFNIALMLPPTIGPTDFIDGPSLYISTGLRNVLYRARELENNLNTVRTLNTAFADYEILPGLKYRINVGADMILGNSERWAPKFERGLANNVNASSWSRRSQDISWLIENTLTYDKTFAERHNLSFLIGQTSQKSEFSVITAEGADFPSNDVRAISLSNSELRGASGGGTRWALASYIGRFNYNLDDKYLFTASIRVDGSSRFGSKNRWGSFPSFSAGWRLSEEPFFNVGWVDDLKIRGSWGQLGSDRIGDFNYLTTFSANTEYTLGGGAQAPVPGVSLARLANPGLRWETSTQSDIGVDLALFDGKVTLIADYYIKETTDLLVDVPIPRSSGIPTNPTVNGGSVRNSGLELALGYRNDIGDFSYDVNLNFATINNEVTSIGSGQPINGGSDGASDRFAPTRTEVGQPIGYYYGFVIDGIYQTPGDLADVDDFRNPVPGDFIFRDINSRDENGNIINEPDGKVDFDDRTFIGSPVPDFNYGLNINLKYKNFDLNVFAQGVQGNEIFSVIKQQTWQMSYFNGNGVTNSVREMMNRWRGPGTSNSIPRIAYQEVNNYPFSSQFYVEDGSFMRLRNLQLGYTLSPNLTSILGVAGVRLYVGAQNLFTITNYSGFDPEVGDRNQNPLSSGIDYGNYPLPRTYRVGANINF
ncbi:MAG: SusC/RagA family TonB-linked outer membrane protein [Cyclobacteriaceae bacterium]